ncbi:hypothetical protein CJ195_11155 [Bacillus sp. UMB0899]|nr:hypothetical protein CJ195_11155 [Bacillus sp. UMB0899]
MEKTLNKIIRATLIIAVLVPVLINVLMFINITPVAGDEKTWISTLGSFWGTIIGGIIAGAITLYGVRATIKSSEEGINRTLREQRAIREEEKQKFILLLDRNIVYGDKLLFTKLIELSWSGRSSDPVDVTISNETYKEINSIISKEVESLRKDLELPELYNVEVDNLIK